MSKKIFRTACLSLILGVIFSFPIAAVADKPPYPIGHECTDAVHTNGECASGDCEKSSKDGKNYCDCDDSDTSIPSEDCQKQYGEKPSDGGEWICKDGAGISYDLDYCISTKATATNYKDNLHFPLEDLNKDPNIFARLSGALFDTTAAQVALKDELKTFKPATRVKIPNLNFTDVENAVDDEGYLNLPWIGEYIKTIYNFGLLAASIIAVIMIIIEAAKIITSAGGENKVAGYKKIGKILIGMIITWCSYVILYTINPALVQFKPLRIKYIEPTALEDAVDLGETELGEAEHPVSASSNPVNPIFAGQAHAGETVVGACHIIPVGSFPSFDINAFGDGSNGRCLLQEFITDGKNTINVETIKAAQTYLKKGFLGKTITVNTKIAPIMQKISNEILIKAQTSPIVSTWADNFTTEGGFVLFNPTDPGNGSNTLLDECNKPGKQETWVVSDSAYKRKYRLLTNLLKNLHGQKKAILGDMHSMGLAIDVYAGSNWNSKPLYTQVPSEVVDIFYNNGFSWLGATAGRDAMHFQYFGNKCFTGLKDKYPDGVGCCIDKWGIISQKVIAKKKNPSLFVYPIPLYNDCPGGNKPVPYLNCLGPTGKPGSMWLREPKPGESSTGYVNQ